jgi:hypothetical protein
MQDQGRWCPEHNRRECVHPRSRGRGTCHGPAVKGNDSCRMHLGRNAQLVKQEQERRMAIEEAAERFGLVIDTTPEDALMDALAHAAGDVVFYRGRVAELNRDQMVYASERITRVERPSAQAVGGRLIEDRTVLKSRPHVWLTLLNEAQRHLAEVAKTCAALNIAGRRLALDEEHGAFIADAVGRILLRFGVRADDPLLPLVVGEVLEELTGEGMADDQ